MVLPKDHCPVCAASVVLLFTGAAPPGGGAACVLGVGVEATVAAPSVAATVVAVDILDVLRD